MSPLQSSEAGKGTVAIAIRYDFGSFNCKWTGTVPFTFTPGNDFIFGEQHRVHRHPG